MTQSNEGRCNAACCMQHTEKRACVRFRSITMQATADQLKQIIAETLSPYGDVRKAGECKVYV